MLTSEFETKEVTLTKDLEKERLRVVHEMNSFFETVADASLVLNPSLLRSGVLHKLLTGREVLWEQLKEMHQCWRETYQVANNMYNTDREQSNSLICQIKRQIAPIAENALKLVEELEKEWIARAGEHKERWAELEKMGIKERKLVNIDRDLAEFVYYFSSSDHPLDRVKDFKIALRELYEFCVS